MCKENKITFLIGAGASYGHCEDKLFCPPTMKDFLSSSFIDGKLTYEYSPDLINYIKKPRNHLNNHAS